MNVTLPAISAVVKLEIVPSQQCRSRGAPGPPQAPLSPWSPERCLAFHTTSLNKALLYGRSALCLRICTVRHWSNPRRVDSIAVIAVSA